MKTLGLIGGMTYHATILYYKQINDHIQRTLGGGHSASLVLRSFDFADIILSRFRAEKFDEVEKMLCEAAKDLKISGAEAIVLCVNTMHRFAEQVESAAGIPLLHIIDFSAEAIKKKGLHSVGLLGTKQTMEGEFIKGRLERKFGLKVLVPSEEAMNLQDSFIFGDLAESIVTERCKAVYLESVDDLVRRGAQGIILGCTELQFVLEPNEVAVPLFDTVELHARGAAEWSLDN